jgi:outer membrane protein assembly factor BamB
MYSHSSYFVKAINTANGKTLWAYYTDCGRRAGMTAVASCDTAATKSGRHMVGTRAGLPALSRDGKTLFFGSSYGYPKGAGMFAVDAESGGHKWFKEPGSASQYNGDSSWVARAPPVVSLDDSTIFFGATGKNWDMRQSALYALKAADGTEVWTKDIGEQTNIKPVLSADGVILYWGGYVLTAATGEADVGWEPKGYGKNVWGQDLSTKSYTWTTPVLDPTGTIIYYAGSNTLFAFNAKDGTPVWCNGRYHSSIVWQESVTLSGDGKLILIPKGEYVTMVTWYSPLRLFSDEPIFCFCFCFCFCLCFCFCFLLFAFCCLLFAVCFYVSSL